MSIRKYFSRPTALVNLDDYDDPVVGSETNQDVDLFKYLFQDCFSHHLIEELCGDTEVLHPDLGDSKRIIDSDNLDAYFLRRKGCVPQLSATANSDVVDIQGNKKSFAQFVKAITDPPLRTEIPDNAISVGENRVSYLVGDAGMGKTFTVLKLIDELRTQGEDYRGYRPIPIYVDLHQGSHKLHPTHNIGPEFFRTLLSKILDVAASKKILRKENFLLPSEDTSLDKFFRNLALQFARMKYFLIFIFDNTDRFYFDNAKYVFFPKHAAKRDESIDQNLLTLIRKFVEESELGKIGASILFVCRKYVFNHCRQLQDAANRTRPILAKHSVFQLIPISEKELIESRFALLRDAVASIGHKVQTSGKSKQYSTQLTQLEESLRNSGNHRDNRTLALIHKLGHQGLRSFLDFLSQLDIDYRDDYQLIDRLFNKPHNLLRLYLTNTRKRFSQRVGHFPNLFLVDGLVDQRKGFEDAHASHTHSYWLKYLMLRYCFLQPRQSASSQEIIEYFHEQLGFELGIVRLALGSLADPCAGRCLDIVPNPQGYNGLQLLKLSSRGEVLIAGLDGKCKEPLCFDFDYLQLVTDDLWLAFPTPWVNEIYVDATIGHTLKNNKEYGRGTEATLAKKVPAVLHFFKALESTSRWELSIREKLANKIHGHLLMPDFDHLEKQLFDSLSLIYKPLPGIFVPGVLKDANLLWRKLSGDTSIDRLLSGYGESKQKISLEM